MFPLQSRYGKIFFCFSSNTQVKVIFINSAIRQLQRPKKGYHKNDFFNTCSIKASVVAPKKLINCDTHHSTAPIPLTSLVASSPAVVCADAGAAADAAGRPPGDVPRQPHGQAAAGALGEAPAVPAARRPGR